MSFELLPNEILLDLFDYFDSTELFSTFDGLNSRFDNLIYDQRQTYRFNFTSASKRNLDRICQQHLPIVADRVIALSFSDCDTTPYQTALFFSYVPLFRQFTHLKLLSIADVRSYQLLMKIINECQHLHNLTHLKLRPYTLRNNQTDFQLIMNNIWTLPRLIQCDFHTCIEQQRSFCAPVKVSASLKCVSIDAGYFNWNEITRLIKCTPHLTRLSISISDLNLDNYRPSFFPTLTHLKITTYDQSGIEKMFVFLEHSPNLYCLDVDLRRILIDGHQWQRIICDHLPKLKIFRFRMAAMLDYDRNIQERVDELVDSFRDSFWIDEHRWFIRCYVQEKIIISSAPSKPDSYFPNKRFKSITSTCPYNDEQEFYNNMNRITDEAFFDQPIPFYVQLPNIELLDIKLPINDQFWSRVPSLNRLRSLSISSHIDTFQSQLQALLDRAPQLDVLFMQQGELLPLQRSLFSYINISVRHLYLQRNNPRFNEEECMALTRCPLTAHCEVLSIRVSSRESIIYLVENMIKLRSLNVKYDDDDYHKHITVYGNDDETRDLNKSVKDKLVQWLQDRLPLTSCIVRHPSFPKNILIWI